MQNRGMTLHYIARVNTPPCGEWGWGRLTVVKYLLTPLLLGLDKEADFGQS